MGTKLLLLVVSVAALSSCSTLYKSGQTPDDVYYSPARTYGEARVETRRDAPSDDTRYYGGNDYYSRSDYRNIRMGINDRRWRYFDNDFGYNPYNFGFNYGYYYNPYYWPSPVYNNYYGPIVGRPVNPKITTPRIANLSGYSSNYYNSNLSNTKSGAVRPARSYNNSNARGSGVGNAIRQIFTPGNTPATNSRGTNNNNTYNNRTPNNNNRTYTPATNNSSSSSSSRPSSSGSSSGGGVSRPPRGGN